MENEKRENERQEKKGTIYPESFVKDFVDKTLWKTKIFAEISLSRKDTLWQVWIGIAFVEKDYMYFLNKSFMVVYVQ